MNRPLPHLVRVWMPTVLLAIGFGWQDCAAQTANPGVPWPATDALGRTLPLAAEVGPPRTNRFVGIFYFLWHDRTCPRSPALDGPYDIARIMARDPRALEKPDSPLWGPIGASHYWGEPLYGYYTSDDPWVPGPNRARRVAGRILDSLANRTRRSQYICAKVGKIHQVSRAPAAASTS